MEVVPVSSLWPKNSTLRALASLLTADDPQVNKAAADYLSSGASRSHFRTRVSGATQKAQVFSYHLHHFSLSWQVLHVMFGCVFRLWSATPRLCQRLEFRARGPLAQHSAVCRSVAL